MSRRIVITGVGCITPLGTEIDQVWRNLTEGRSGIGPITAFDARAFPVQIAAEVRNWDLSDVGEDPGSWAKHPRQTWFAIGAGKKAVRGAGLDTSRLDPCRLGVYLGCGETFPDLEELGRVMAPAIREGQLDGREFVRRAVRGMDPERARYCGPDVPAQCLGALLNAQGPNLNCIAACASGTQAIGNAAEIIRRGEADVMLAGAAHSLINPMGMTGLHLLSVLSAANDRQQKAMRPFDAGRDGFVVGEGGAVVVLESLDHARARGAEIWGELSGYASGHTAYHLTDVAPDGLALARCIAQALRQARLNVDDVEYINAHGTSTRMNDHIETLALKQVFGAAAYRIPVSSTKSMLGHATTACGAIELVAALMAVRTGVIPPTINYPDPECDLDYVPNEARDARLTFAMSNSFGLGGQNACVVFGRV